MSVECSVCFESFGANVDLEVVATKCGHMFHINCLNDWTKKSNTCPQCRVVMRRTGWRKVYLDVVDTHNTSLAFAEKVLEKEKIEKENQELKKSLQKEKRKYKQLFSEHKSLQMEKEESSKKSNNKPFAHNINTNTSTKANAKSNANANETNNNNSPATSTGRKHTKPNNAHINKSKVANGWKVSPI